MQIEEGWRERIRIDPAIHHGDPCIAGTRVPVRVIVGSVADGDTTDAILAGYPQLTREDVRAALLFAAEAVRYPQQFDPGRGDYTRERSQWLDSLTMDDIVRDIGELRKARPEGDARQ